MKSKVIIGIMLIVLLVGILTLTFNIQPAKASGTIYIKADGSIDPPTANIASSDNVTYYFTGNNYDEIEIQRDNIVVDGAGYTLQGTASMTGGINLSNRNNVTIKNIQIKGFDQAIQLYMSSNIRICGNKITNSSFSATQTATIALHTSSNNSIYGNNITESWHGIAGVGSSNNRIYGNNITNNGGAGIALAPYPLIPTPSNNNMIYENNIIDNDRGIWLQACSSHTIYHNNFVNNTNQAYTELSYYDNVWDDGYPSGGNYWSNYNGTDADGDGIGDTPYVIDANNTDRYPLMNPWSTQITPPVGGLWIPVNKFSLLAPYIALVSTIILAVSISLAYIKHRKKQ